MACNTRDQLLLKRANPTERRGRKVTGLREAIPMTAGLPVRLGAKGLPSSSPLLLPPPDRAILLAAIGAGHGLFPYFSLV